MGKEKTTVQQESTQKATMTPAEQEMQNLQLAQYKQIQPQQTQSYRESYNLINQLLTGGTLPGYLSSLSGGISNEAIGQQAANYAQKSMPGLQSMGITDSGEAYKSVSKGIANEVLLPTAEYNSNLLLNLLNLASGNASAGTAQFQSGTNTLANQLAGLRTMQSSGITTQKSMNPFLKSFEQSAGSGMGNLFNPQTYFKPMQL